MCKKLTSPKTSADVKVKDIICQIWFRICYLETKGPKLRSKAIKYCIYASTVRIKDIVNTRM